MCDMLGKMAKQRINGVIKNNYLKHRNINTYEELVKEVTEVCTYNRQTPY